MKQHRPAALCVVGHGDSAARKKQQKNHKSGEHAADELSPRLHHIPQPIAERFGIR